VSYSQIFRKGYYNITVFPVQSIEAHRGGDIAPLILKVGTDGTSGQLHALTACFTPNEKRPVGYSQEWEAVWVPKPV
jgi:hypothetical protein